jgi:hypothetical protein
MEDREEREESVFSSQVVEDGERKVEKKESWIKCNATPFALILEERESADRTVMKKKSKRRTTKKLSIIGSRMVKDGRIT